MHLPRQPLGLALALGAHADDVVEPALRPGIETEVGDQQRGDEEAHRR